MSKKEVVIVLIVSLLLAGFGIYRAVTVNIYHDHTKDAWRNTPVNSGISVAMPKDNETIEDD